MPLLDEYRGFAEFLQVFLIVLFAVGLVGSGIIGEKSV